MLTPGKPAYIDKAIEHLEKGETKAAAEEFKAIDDGIATDSAHVSDAPIWKQTFDVEQVSK